MAAYDAWNQRPISLPQSSSFFEFVFVFPDFFREKLLLFLFSLPKAEEKSITNTPLSH